ncbi:peroxisomal sarcosine oxidase-like isoform X1 [Glandiceps talaboti]
MSSNSEQAVVWDAVVVGAGIEGSATAYQLAKNKQRTLLLEQFGLPHSRGSSHGQSRIVRYGYDQDYYTAMMPEAFQIWHEVETELSIKLITETPILSVCSPPYDVLAKKIDVLQKAGLPCETLSHQEIMNRFPGMTFGSDFKGVLEKRAGVIRADKALASLQQLFKKYGGTICDEEKLLDILPGVILTLKTSKGTHKARNVILAPGPWAGQLFGPLGIHVPLKPQRIRVCYWREKSPGTYANFPAFLDLATHHKYGLPPSEYPNMVKICYHKGPDVDPDHRDDIGDYREDLDILEKYVSEHFPGLENKPCIQEACMYTWTPDEDFILDRHPHFSNIIMAAGFSGHGFKLAPIVGKVLSELAMNRKPSYDLSPFKIDRFFKSPTAKL